jgi:hypothetical protein
MKKIHSVNSNQYLPKQASEVSSAFMDSNSNLFEDDSTMSDYEILMKLLMGKESSSMNIYQKFADISPYKILEENLLISCDGTEVIFRVI